MTVAVGDLLFDFGRRVVLRSGQTVRLSRKAFDLLETLLRNRHRVLCKGELLERLWPETFVVETNLFNLVSEIRRLTGDDPRRPRLIRTIHGVGYIFCGEVSAQDEEQSEGYGGPARCWLFSRDWSMLLREGEHLIGRSRHSAVFIGSEAVSRNHARLVVAPQGVFLMDLDSTNGTYVAGQRITSTRRLRDGDEVCVGDLVMTVRIPSQQEGPTAKTSHPLHARGRRGGEAHRSRTLGPSASADRAELTRRTRSRE